MSEDNKEYTLTFDGLKMSSIDNIHKMPEEETDYILEEDLTELKTYIDALIARIRDLKMQNARLQGENEVWEKSWRIWNGEERE